METFKKAIEEVLQFEGGYVNDPDDPGKETNWGISSKHHPEITDVAALTLEDAIQIYYKDYWVVGKAYMVEDQAVANKLLSMQVNAGVSRGTLVLQRALRSVHASVTEDGIMGPETAGAVNSSDPKQLLAAYRAECGAFYAALICRRPVLAKYENGWLRRAYA
jgi:lysozyme family protein